MRVAVTPPSQKDTSDVTDRVTCRKYGVTPRADVRV